MFKDAEQTLPRLVKRLKGRPDLWHSVYANFQTSASNAILNYHPKAWKVLWGPPALREQVGQASFFFSPQIFRQSNLDAFERGIIPAVVRRWPAWICVSYVDRPSLPGTPTPSLDVQVRLWPAWKCCL